MLDFIRKLLIKLIWYSPEFLTQKKDGSTASTVEPVPSLSDIIPQGQAGCKRRPAGFAMAGRTLDATKRLCSRAIHAPLTFTLLVCSRAIHAPLTFTLLVCSRAIHCASYIQIVIISVMIFYLSEPHNTQLGNKRRLAIRN